MKKITLPAVFMLFLTIIAFVGCADDTETAPADTAATPSAMLMRGGNLWSGEVGVFDETSFTYVITGDKEGYKLALEEVLRQQDNPTTIESLEIVEKVASNNPDDKAYMLIGSDNLGTSIGVFLQRRANSLAMEDPGTITYTTCRGCATGCNLQYYTINGKKIPFCNENGCVYDCEKSQITE